MIPATDPFMAGVRPAGLQRGRGGFLRSADDAPYVSDPSGEVCKTGDRKGEVKRLKYGSPSNRGREIENDAGLVKYRQRLSFAGIGMSDDLARACKALVDLPVGSPEFNSAADHIAVEADKLTRSSLAADRGTHGHAICELWDLGKGRCTFTADFIAQGEALGIDKLTQLRTSTAWAAMLRDNGLEILAIEASCVDDRWRLAGTLDRLVRTTRPLTFVKKSGELVIISARTVLVLDIKFGKCRLAHPIQIASYAQSVPYDTDTETRGVWPWPIDQTHALIAHGDFGDDTRPVSIELVWVDLVAGREHGGQCVVDAKAWAARDDVFSVAQIVEGAPLTKALRAANRGIDHIVEGETGRAPDVGLDELSTLSSAGAPEPSAPSTVGEEAGAANTGHSPTSTWPLADPTRLALVDARGTLCATPNEGADLDDGGFDELWDRLRTEFDALDPAAKAWRSQLAQRASQRGVSFLAQEARTERRYSINRGLIALAIVDPDDQILRALLYIVLGEIAWFVGIEPGHLVGSLDYMQAAKFADLCDTYISPPPAA